MCFERYLRKQTPVIRKSAFSSPSFTASSSVPQLSNVSHPKIRAIHRYPSLPESELRKITGSTRYTMSGVDMMMFAKPRNTQFLTPVIVKMETIGVNPYLEDEGEMESTA